MSELQIAVLALVQGITEFLPISSTGHLILVPILTGWPDQGLYLDVAVHVGSLGAVMLYFWRDIGAMAGGLVSWRQAAPLDQPGRRLLALILVGTLPVVIGGFLFTQIGTEGLRSATVVGWATIIFAVFLYVADGLAHRHKEIAEMNFSDALLIGLSQIFALIPGTSRSGVTMTSARMLGYDRSESARFSSLLSIPTILAAGTLLTFDLIRLGKTAVTADIVFGAALAFLSALAALAVMMRWLRRSTFTPFVVYRILLGTALLGYAYLT